MEGLSGFFNHVMLSRVQFAFTAIFHIIFPVLTIGLLLFLVAMEVIWLKTGKREYYHHLRFWSRLFIINFAVGVATGIVMEFQFGTNWNVFSKAGGDVFGHLLGFEAAMSFMLEASFLGVMIFAWYRVPRGIHLLSTSMVAFGAILSGFWIMVANAWMQSPTGGYMLNGRFHVTDQWRSIMNPFTEYSVGHMLVACAEISLFVVGAVSGWYMLKDRNKTFFLISFKMAVVAAILITPLQIYLGDGSGRTTFIHQPAKLAAMESHWETNKWGEGAPWRVLAWPLPDKQENLWEVNLPHGLSLIVTRSWTGQVMGLKEFPLEEVPPVWLPFYGFRIMIALGFAFFFLMVWTLWRWFRGKLTPESIHEQKWLLYSWIAAAPLSYLATECGWVVREVGRQPWTMYGLVRTGESASNLPAGAVGASFFGFSALYPVLMLVFLIFVRRVLVEGPRFERLPE